MKKYKVSKIPKIQRIKKKIKKFHLKNQNKKKIVKWSENPKKLKNLINILFVFEYEKIGETKFAGKKIIFP